MLYTEVENEFLIKTKKLSTREVYDIFIKKFPEHPVTVGALGHRRSKLNPHELKKSRKNAPLYEIRPDGIYKVIKIAQPNTWMQLHRWIYTETHPEEAGRPLTQNDVIKFLDGDLNNFSPDNLIRVPRGLIGIVNRVYGGFTNDPEVNKIKLAQAFLHNKTLDAEDKAGQVSKYIDKTGRVKRISTERKNANSKAAYRKLRQDPERVAAYKAKKNAAKKRMYENMTEAEREAYRAKQREYRQRALAKETPEERAARMQKFNNYQREYRKRKAQEKQEETK